MAGGLRFGPLEPRAAASGVPRLALRFLQAAIVCIFVANVVHWSLLFPENATPDERTRYYFVEYVLHFGVLPDRGIASRPFIGNLTGTHYGPVEWWYCGLPNLDAFGATATAWLFESLFDAPHKFMAARAFNLLLAAPFALACLGIAGELCRRGMPAIVAALCVLAIPQLTFIFSYVNSDALALVAAMTATCCTLVHLRTGTMASAVGLGVACAVLLCSKIYYVPAIFANLCLVALAVYSGRNGPVSVRATLGGLTALLVVAVPVLSLTYAGYGDVFGMKGQADFIALYRSDPVLRYGTCFVFCHGDDLNGPEIRSWLKIISGSFFYATGWMDIWLPDFVYWRIFAPIVAALLALSLASAVTRSPRLFRGERGMTWPAGCVLLFWAMLAGVLLLNLIGQQGIAPQPQGRYLFVVVPFLAVMLAVLIGLETGRREAATYRVFLGAAALALIAINMAGYEVAAHSPNRVAR